MNRKACLVTVLAVIISAILFYGLYLTDNKYKHPSPQAEYGVLLLDDDDPPLIYLIQGWEFYQYQLLSPEDFDGADAPVPTDYVYIGQYMGFDMDDINASPFGSATYRMNIFTGTDTSKRYTLELPEIFSAYCLWINGELLAQNGNPGRMGEQSAKRTTSPGRMGEQSAKRTTSPGRMGEQSAKRTTSPDPSEYTPELSHGSITFTAKDRIDIIFSVTNFGHYYSGLVYPPAFGQIREVNKVINVSMVISALCCFFAIAVGLFYLFVGLFIRDRKTSLAFGILCFLYAGSASHQLVHFVASNYFVVWYAIEDICFYALLAGLVYISALIFRPQSRFTGVIPIIGIVVGVAVVTASFMFTDGLSLLAVCLSLLVKAYKLTVICLLCYMIMKATGDDLKYSIAMLVAVSLFGVSLFVDMAARLYEPMRYGWPTEIGGFVMVCVLGVIITLDAIDGLREGISLAIKNEQLGMSYDLLTQKIEQTKRSSHDLRHHMAVLSGYLQSRDFEGMATYISKYTQRLPVNEELHFSKISAIDAVARYYYMLAKNDEVDISVNISLPETALPEQDLCVLFGNLLENAIDACCHVKTDKKYIRFMVTSSESVVTIVSDNSFDGICSEDKGIFHSRKRHGAGTGTASIKAIAGKYDGYADFCMTEDEFQASVVLQL